MIDNNNIIRIRSVKIFNLDRLLQIVYFLRTKLKMGKNAYEKRRKGLLRPFSTLKLKYVISLLKSTWKNENKLSPQ